jgi:DNA-binding NarL/FixJ family response regulator
MTPAYVRGDTYLPDAILQQISISLIPTATVVVYIGFERVMNEMPKPLQVYIVEDSEIVERFLASAIVAAGAEVSGFSADAETAIGDVFALQPDLIMIDIGLASGSGFDVLKKLQDHSLVPAATKVVLTNHAGAESQILSLELGADRFFDKASETSQALALISAMAAERLGGSAPPRHGV